MKNLYRHQKTAQQMSKFIFQEKPEVPVTVENKQTTVEANIEEAKETLEEIAKRKFEEAKNALQQNEDNEYLSDTTSAINTKEGLNFEGTDKNKYRIAIYNEDTKDPCQTIELRKIGKERRGGYKFRDEVCYYSELQLPNGQGKRTYFQETDLENDFRTMFVEVENGDIYTLSGKSILIINEYMQHFSDKNLDNLGFKKVPEAQKEAVKIHMYSSATNNINKFLSKRTDANEVAKKKHVEKVEDETEALYRELGIPIAPTREMLKESITDAKKEEKEMDEEFIKEEQQYQEKEAEELLETIKTPLEKKSDELKKIFDVMQAVPEEASGNGVSVVPIVKGSSRNKIVVDWRDNETIRDVQTKRESYCYTNKHVKAFSITEENRGETVTPMPVIDTPSAEDAPRAFRKPGIEAYKASLEGLNSYKQVQYVQHDSGTEAIYVETADEENDKYFHYGNSYELLKHEGKFYLCTNEMIPNVRRNGDPNIARLLQNMDEIPDKAYVKNRMTPKVLVEYDHFEELDMTKPENEKMVESFYSAVEEQMKLITEIKQESSDDFKKTEEEKSIENSNTVIDKLK